MKQEQFTRIHRADWERLQAMLDAIDAAGNRPSRVSVAVDDLPRLYRLCSHHLSLARSRAYSPQLIAHLSDLIARGHQVMYRNRPPLWPQVVTFLAGGFPRLVRQQWRAVAVAAGLFLGPMLAMLLVVQLFPQAVYTVIEPWQLSMMEQMYDPGDSDARLGESRGSDSDIRMFAFYIRNNTGIGFNTFAGGLLFGLGTLFFLVYNGLLIGAIAGHMTVLSYIETFWGFVSGHSAFELTAIILSGAAGLKLGWALIAPGQLTRMRALREAAGVGVRIIYGAALLFFAAAFVEGFWSSMAGIPATIKYAVGIALWLLLWGYLLLAGRR